VKSPKRFVRRWTSIAGALTRSAPAAG